MASILEVPPQRREVAVTSTVPPPLPEPARERLLALDVFRGITIAAMLLVNDPGSWSAIYPPLEHAPWHGWTPTDLIFPFFLWGKIAGNADPSFLDRVVYRAAHLRFLGVLQRIGIAYIFAALLTLRTTLRQQIAII